MPEKKKIIVRKPIKDTATADLQRDLARSKARLLGNLKLLPQSRRFYKRRQEMIEAELATRALIEAARNIEMTPQQAAEQRRSFAYGNCKIENDLITREMVDAADERLHGAGQ